MSEKEATVLTENLSMKDSINETGSISTLEELKEFLKKIPDNEIVTISIEMTKSELEKGVKVFDGRAESERGV